MEPIDHAMEPRRWAEVHFGEAPLTDVRRVERLKTIAEALGANPGASIPQLFARPYDVKAAYTFATPDADISTSVDMSAERLRHRLVSPANTHPGQSVKPFQFQRLG
jgi:Transposase DNA-binding